MNKLFLILLFPLVLFGFDASDTARLNDPKYLQGYWKLAGDAKDYSGHGNHGTLSGTEAYQQGPYGKDVGSFTGANYVILPKATLSNVFTSSWTISCWVKRTTQATTTGDAIFSWSNGDITSDVNARGILISYPIRVAQPTTFVTYVRTVGSTSLSGFEDSSKYFSNTHLVLSCNGSTIAIYRDSKLITTISGYAGPLTSTGTMAIGSWVEFARTFDGTINNFRLYNIALTASEISALYQLDSQPSLPPVLPRYTATNNPDPTLLCWINNGRDISTNNRTITNYKVSTGSGPMRFNGVDSYLSTPDFLGVSDFTFSCWYRANGYGEGSAGRLITNTKVIAYLSTTTTIVATSDGSTSSNAGILGYKFPQWNHFALTRIGTTTTFYHNGIATSIGNGGNPTAATTLYIGGNNGANTFDGLISDPKFYSGAKSADWIAQDYVNGRGFYK